MGRYLLAVIHPDGRPSADDDVDIEAVFAAVDAFNRELDAAGRMIFATGLKPAATARTVRLDAGRPTITDGPHTETDEVMGGFWIVRATQDEIDEIATEAARACHTTIEVRPLEDEPES